MARYGRLLLQRITFQYCDRMGSSRGMREYIDQCLPVLKDSLKQSNPTLQIDTVQLRNRFPLVKAEYAPLANSNLAHLEQHVLQQPCHRQQRKAGPRRAQQQYKKGLTTASLNSNTVGVKHQSASDIKQVVWWLTQSQGRPATRRVPNKHIRTRRHSIQGAWNASTFASQ